MKLFKNIFLAFALVFFLFSCTPLGCLDDTVATVKAGFYRTGSDQITPPDSVTVYGTGIDTLMLYNKSLKKRVIELPLNSSSGICCFVVRINGNQDTVCFSYSNYPHLISKECGVSYFHYLDSVKSTKLLIDTVIIMNQRATTGNEENIRIFY